MREFENESEIVEPVSTLGDAIGQSTDSRRKTYHLMIGVAVVLAVIGSLCSVL